MKTHTARRFDTHENTPQSARRRRGNHWRWMGLAGLSLLLLTTLACINRPVRRAIPDPMVSFTESVPQNTDRDVDILFVVDDSRSMQDEQERLSENFESLMTTLKRTRGGLPNVHIGVTSTDIGAPGTCVGEGRNGALQRNDCTALASGNYIIDTEPTGCDVDKTLDDQTGALTQCGANNCTPDHCAEPGTDLVVDELGCPRCRNYTDSSLEDLFKCMAKLGTDGCGFEQPLEAMYRALDDHPDNVGFVRENAYLTVVFVTDEDDCSASDPAIFSDANTAGGVNLGPAGDFRCFDFGVVCDQNNRESGTHTNCRPREGDSSKMHDLGRYKDLLHELKDESMVIVAAIAGPVDSGSVDVAETSTGWTVERSCGAGEGAYDGARPGTRLNAFVTSLTGTDDMDWAYTSICSDSYDAALTGIGDKLVALMDTCPPVAFKGCHAPEVDANDNVDVASCMPQCSVTDKTNKGGTDEQTRDVPHCLEVCPDGLCDGNADPSQSYAGGQPPQRDEDLPVEACWYTHINPSCLASAGAELVIARRTDPPPRTFTKISCAGLQTTEQLCNDKVDNDQDGLIDSEDPDCAPQH